MEHKMANFATAHNELVDAHNEKEDELELLNRKMPDLEDRSRINNVQLRRVAESVPPADLRQFVKQLITTLLPDTPPREVTVDWAHRLPKPQHLPEKIPRDVIAHINFFHVKDDLMHFARQNSPLSDPYAGIAIYAAPLTIHYYGLQKASSSHQMTAQQPPCLLLGVSDQATHHKRWPYLRC